MLRKLFGIEQQPVDERNHIDRIPRKFSKEKPKGITNLDIGASFTGVKSISCTGDIFYPGDVICTLRKTNGETTKFWRIPVTSSARGTYSYETDGSMEIIAHNTMQCEVKPEALICKDDD